MKFKKWETKKDLRLKIAELNGMLSMSRPTIHTIERNVLKLSYSMSVEHYPAPTEIIKEQIGRGLGQQLMDFIEWDIVDSSDYGKRMITGSIFLATNRK